MNEILILIIAVACTVLFLQAMSVHDLKRELRHSKEDAEFWKKGFSSAVDNNKKLMEKIEYLKQTSSTTGL